MSSFAMYGANRSQHTLSNSQSMRKQRSFGENYISSDSNRSSRGKSTNRGGSVLLTRLPSERNKVLYLQKQRSVVDQVCAGIRGRSEQRSRKFSLCGIGDKGNWTTQLAGGPKLAWTDNSLDCDKLIESGTFLSSNCKKNSPSQSLISERIKKSSGSSKAENKINLNINLTQSIRSVDNDSIYSDIDNSSDGADHLKISSQQTVPKKPLLDKSNVQSDGRLNSAAQRRAQFGSSKGEQISTSTINQVVSFPGTTQVALRASPSLTIQKRPPLVRAMSAPVRSIADTTKNLLANTRRKSRRRRILPKNSSCEKDEAGDTLSFKQNGKKILSRSRSTIGSDVITLVSLASSEGSESEKEESGSTDECQTARAPSLRKTGKSVSFQENEHPSFQMVVKEFPHMLRRGSIAPLAARLRANRPPTAPPGSIFRTDFENCTIKMTKNQSKDDMSNESDGKESKTFVNKNSSSYDPELSPSDYDFPSHVRSIKERECWKLFQKMLKKGVSVKYDTILRGMLTPTEFRQLQKQRDLETAENQETEDNNDNDNETANNEQNNILNKINTK